VATHSSIYLGAVFLSLFTARAVIRLARPVGITHRSGMRSVHRQPIPPIVGVAIFLPVTALILAVLFLNNAAGDTLRRMRLEITTLFVFRDFLITRFTDDLRGLPA